MSKSREKRGFVQREVRVNILRELKAFNADVSSVEEEILLLHQAKGMRAEYDARNIPAPEWLDDVIRRLTRAIEAQTRDAKELRLKEIRAAKAGLMTASEKREQLAREEAEIEAQLAGVK